jgi:hypothetical protein
MGQEHVPDPAAEPVGVLNVVVHVALRVDHGRGLALLVGDEVGSVSQAT